MRPRKVLNIAVADLKLQNLFHKELGISKITAQLLANRGVDSLSEADKFLRVSPTNLLDPFSFQDMPKAVKLIKEFIKNKEKILIFSDYDVDGITSLALLNDTLLKSGADYSHYIPHRVKEGYGLSKNIVSIAKDKKAKLVITADCGINSHKEICDLRHNGIEVIVTDHHEPFGHEKGIAASAVINPKVKDSNYGYRDLAGVGVVYKLCQALTRNLLQEDLDLVSLGTIADSVPLTGENRIIAKEGLMRISKTERPGLKALLETSGIKDKVMTSEFVSFILGPRINACGRLDSAELSLKLLMSRDEAQALEIAEEIEKYNRQRQKIESGILEEAYDLVEREIDFKEHKVLVIAKEGWHQGLLGIVAAKIMDKFYRPTIIISKTDGLCRGSGRSIKNFHLFESLSECAELLESFGGHKHATGLVIASANIEEFRNKINLLAKEKLRVEDLLPGLDIDMELNLSDLDHGFVRELDILEPFGT
ncbi:single-stranded-DNA-specific exonuclease RecJ, partial [bacterium]